MILSLNSKYESGRNVIITGVARGGTTLSCNLLNLLPDVVALHEPLDVLKFGNLKDDEIILRIDEFVTEQRKSLLSNGTAKSKSFNGRVPQNHLDDALDRVTGQRRRLINGDEIKCEKPLSDAFTLCIKHPMLFTALLDRLVGRYECFAIIRNPLSVLMSWETAGMAVSDGWAPAAENVDPVLAAVLAAAGGPLDRKLLLLSWIFDRYKMLPPDQIIRYEDIVATGGRALASISGAAADLDQNLETRNARHASAESFGRYASLLISFAGAYLDFYSAADIGGLLQGGA